MFYIIHGDNALEREEALHSFLAQHADADPMGMNKEKLGPPLTLEALRRACDTLPFLGGSRIVIAHNVLGKGSEAWLEGLLAYLPQVPSSALLIFVEEHALPAKHPVLKLATKTGAEVHAFALPKPWEVAGWIQKRARDKGIQIEAGAVQLLAHNLGANLQQIHQELEKILLYRGDKGPITAEDVRVMVPYIESADVIFDMVDALGQRDARTAAQHLHRLLGPNEEPPLRIFGMMIRQFRLLTQARWLMDREQVSDSTLAQKLGLHPFVAKKLHGQAQRFTLVQLRQAYRLLIEADLAIKTGQLPGEAALDLLVTELTRL